MNKREKRKRIDLFELEREYLSKIKDFSPSIIIDGREYYFKQRISSDDQDSITWKGHDKFNNALALTFFPVSSVTELDFNETMVKAAKLNGNQEFARIENGQIKTVLWQGKQLRFTVIVEEWIDGNPIKYIKNEVVTIPFILKYISHLCEVLSILKYLKLRHDSLTIRNVLLVRPKPGSLKDELAIKVTSCGHIKDYFYPLGSDQGGLDDVGNFALHIQYLLNKILYLNNGERRAQSKKEIQFYNEAIKLLNQMVETDKNRALTKPFSISQHFHNLNATIFQSDKNNTLKLSDPFDYISAEQISDDILLVKLFADSCPWIKDITGPNPILLTGPRGCGKSMLFRRFSLKALLSVNDTKLDELNIAGFYISCSADLSNKLSIIDTKKQAITFKEEIIHFFNLILLKEIISTLRIISERDDSLTRFGINHSLENEIVHYLNTTLKINPEKRISLQGIRPFAHLLELVKYEAGTTYSALVKRVKIKEHTSFGFLADVTKFLFEKIPYFRAKKITFLIDDYSVHRIPEHVQSLLNMVIWDRQSSHIFKVSSEKYGTVKTLFNNTSADLSREYTEIDIGRMYINLSETTKDLRQFSIDLLNHRLALADYQGKAEILIGSSHYSEGSLGKQIASGKSSNDFFHGLDTISQICSGDISTLLEIFRNIFREANVGKQTKNKIPVAKQHNAITSASKNFLELTKTFHPHGNEMYKIVTFFGGLCKKILTDGRPQKDARSGLLIPNETSRIEIEDTELPEEFSQTNEDLYKELIRRAIFIELEPSRGRHTMGVTTRLQLRRIYCPSFGISLSKNTAIKWSQFTFKAFLTEPETVCDLEYNKWKRTKDDNQQALFHEI